MDAIILNKLETVKIRFSELESKISNGSNIVDELREYSKLSEILNTKERYDVCQKELMETKSILSESNDRDMSAFCEEEISRLKSELEQLDYELTDMLSVKDPNDDCNAIFEISGEVGGEEANLFASDLFDMYAKFAYNCGYELELIDEDRTDLGGINYISFKIIGRGAYGKLRYESGIHRVQRVPETEAKGRLHTSTASVMVTPEISVDKFELDLNDIEITACHASGAGGQHINKTSSAIRAVYKPTGLTVFCQSRRSQLQNKEEAIKIIASKLKAERDEKELSAASENKLSVLRTRDRSEKIRTYNYPQNRVTDHRINFSVLKLDKVIHGELDDIIRALHIEAAKERN